MKLRKLAEPAAKSDSDTPKEELRYSQGGEEQCWEPIS